MSTNVTYDKMNVQSLPAGIIIKNFIKGIGVYSYEDFLLEFVNSSSCFLKKSNGEPYAHPADESHGEADCISHNYEMDFKLLASTTFLQGENLFSSQLFHHNGATAFCIPKMTSENSRYKPIQATRIFAATRHLSMEQILAIRNADIPENSVNNDIRNVLLNLEAKKNLLLFFPYNFYFEVNDDKEAGLHLSIAGLTNDFKNIFLYRSNLLPERYTFLCYFYLKELVIAQWANDEFKFVESLPASASPLFCKLLMITDSMFSKGCLK